MAGAIVVSIDWSKTRCTYCETIAIRKVMLGTEQVLCCVAHVEQARADITKAAEMPALQ